MEEKNEIVEEKSENKTKLELKVSKKFLYSFFAIMALALFAIAKICRNFGVLSPIFFGIMSIFIYVLSFTGMMLSLINYKKLTTEFWFNAAVLGISLIFM